jgi:hypothetical protein
MELQRDDLLMKLGAARAKAPAAWRLLDVEVAPEGATFSYALRGGDPQFGLKISIKMALGSR